MCGPRQLYGEDPVDSLVMDSHKSSCSVFLTQVPPAAVTFSKATRFPYEVEEAVVIPGG